MNFQVDTNTIISGFAVVLLTWAIRGIFSIRDHLARLNGSMAVMKEWQEGHEKVDDDRHRESLGRFDAVFNILNKKIDPK